MYHVLVIQLHHPLLARGLNLPAPPANAPESLAQCSTAATEIVCILMAYDRTFSIRKAPYLIAYATYVSATIHVRIAARQLPTSSDTTPSLRTCLDFLNQNRETNPGVENAKASLIRLMNRMGVAYQEEQVPSSARSDISQQSISRYPSTDSSARMSLIPLSSEQSHSAPLDSRMTSNNAVTQDADIDGIMRSFSNGQLSASPSSASLNTPMAPPLYQNPALSTYNDFQSANLFDSTLFDPVGIDYSQVGAGGGEQYNNYTGLVGYGGPMQYPGQLGNFET